MDQQIVKPAAKPRVRFTDRLFGPLGSVLVHGAILAAAAVASTGFVGRIHSSGAEGVSGVFSVGVRGPHEYAELPPRTDPPCPRIDHSDDPPDLPDVDPRTEPVDATSMTEVPPPRKAVRHEVAYETLPSGGDGSRIRFATPGTGQGAKGDGPGDGRATEVYNPAPVYPPKAKRAHIEGEVLVEVAVTERGTCGSVTVVTSSGSSLLDEAAVAAVTKWEFKPATKGGRPVASLERIRFTFSLVTEKQ